MVMSLDGAGGLLPHDFIYSIVFKGKRSGRVLNLDTFST